MLTGLRQRSAAELLLAGEALLLLACFRIALKLVPVRHIMRRVTHGRRATDQPPVQVQDQRTFDEALRVRWAVLAVTRNSPAQFVCFPQSLAAYVMLRRRRIQSTIIYGVARSAAGEMMAHTWLTVGDRTVVGGEGSEAFTPLERWS